MCSMRFQERSGNTALRRTVVRPCVVREINADSQAALISWNGNQPTWWSERRLKTLRRSRPQMDGPRTSLPFSPVVARG